MTINEKLQGLLDGSENLTEEFKTSVASIFQEAIDARVAEVEAECEKQLKEAAEMYVAEKVAHQQKLEEAQQELATQKEKTAQAEDDAARAQQDADKAEDDAAKAKADAEKKTQQILRDAKQDLKDEQARHDAAVEEEVEARVKGMCGEIANTVDNYLKYAVENYVKENKQQIEDKMIDGVNADFIKALVELFAKFNVEVPCTKGEDQVEQVKKECDQIHEELDEAFETINELVAERSKLEEKVKQYKYTAIINKAASKYRLSEAAKARCRQMIKGFGTLDEQAFACKADEIASTLSEAVSSRPAKIGASKVAGSKMISSTPVETKPAADNEKSDDADVQAVLQSLSALRARK